MTEAEGGADDPFDGLRLDEDFVRGASSHEPSAAVRAARAAGDRAPRRRRLPVRRPPRTTRGAARRVRRWRSGLPAVAMVVLIGGAFWNQRTESGGGAPSWLSGRQVTAVVGDGGRPSPQRAASDVPLGTPAGTAAAGGQYRFIATQPGSAQPVAYDPCRPIDVVVGDRAAPPGADGLVVEALAEVSEATGLQFVVEGPTDEVPVAARRPFQPERYGDRWAPVLVAWSDPVELPDLAGQVAGIGGSASAPAAPDGPEVYVSGLVALDGPQLGGLIDRPGGRAQARSVIIHELGHVVGLDHVDDDRQLMHASGRPDVVAPAAGDNAGLAELGRGACVPEI